MKNYFENYFDELDVYTQDYMFSDWCYTDVENYFNSIANSYEDELDRITYAELIAQIGENINYLDRDLMVKMFNAICDEKDLDKLAGYYKFIEGWTNNEPYIDPELWNKFLIEKIFIHLLTYESK
ncbi:hypothetical protein NQV05_01930 [Mycoplasmopsis agalactiae]|uniref:Mbov_0392 family ICE element protein n=1 Tax=Mycoplasmopsis agalactiae TaxID=2110 RepID=UPI00211C0DD6|nr:hypothetical protein [Mycoplasmopsis agalactiae]UUM25882.1 hypothetical protein NQV05_01930 [Mycoplasmopsis agalactiae]